MGIFSDLVAANRKFSDKSELPRALATAGLLTASGWDWSVPFDAELARRQLRSGQSNAWPWVAPPPEAYDVIAGRRAELAGLFQESVIPAGAALLRRLLLRPRIPFHRATGSDLEELRVAADLMVGEPEIGTAAIIDPMTGGGLRKWGWPLRLSIEGLSADYLKRHFHPVDRGLVEPREFGSPADIAFARTLRGVVNARAHMTALVPGADGSGAAPIGDMIGLAPSLAVLRNPADIEGLAKNFVYEMSHDLAPDQALSSATSRLAGMTPLLVLGRDSFASEMENARLSTQLGGMVRRLERLGEIDDTPVFVPSNAGIAYGIHLPGQARPSVLADALRQAIGSGRIRYEREEDAGEATASIAQQVSEREQELRTTARRTRGDDRLPRDESIDILSGDGGADLLAGDAGGDGEPMPRPTRSPPERKKSTPKARATPATSEETGLGNHPPPERDRFTDVGILTGHYFAGEEVRNEDRLDPKSKPSPGADYSLEIAVRAKKLGFELEGKSRAVTPPRREGEMVRIYAAVSAVDPGSIALEDALLPLDWPFDQDSSSAFFRFRPRAKLGAGRHLEIRLLSEDLRLLDHLDLVFKKGRWRLIPNGLEAPIAFPRGDPADEALALHIVDAPNGYGIIVTLKTKDQPPLAVPLARVYRQDDVANLLNDVRRHWTALVIGKMARRPQLTGASFELETKALAGHGRSAWRLLFGDRRGAGAGTGEALARLLSDRPLAKDCPIRISYASNAEDFIYPWSIVSPPPADDDPAGPRFWGLDYQIMLTRKEGRRPPPPSPNPPRLCALVDKNFSAFVDHEATLTRVAKENGDAALSFVSTKEELGTALADANPCDIFYFFCQGLTGAAGAGLAIDVTAEIEQATAGLSDAQREPWQRLLDRLKSQKSGARIFADRIEIGEDELRNVSFFADGRRPFIFLNMCHSAGMLPGSRGGFPAVFLDREASAVIGTEAPVTAQFADAFADRLLPALLRGETLGRAMLDARRSFHADRNPLALLYTLYGRGEARLTEPSMHVASNTERGERR